MKTVAEKLLIKPGAALWVSPQEHLDRLGPLPGGVEPAAELGMATVALVFGRDAQSVVA